MSRKPYRFHLLGLAHLPVSKTYNACAFSMKVHKLSRMLLSFGHEVFLYGAEGTDAPCTEFIQTHTLKDIRDAWGDKDHDGSFAIGYDWQKLGFRNDFNKTRTDTTRKYLANCASEILKRKKPDDFLLVTMGTYQKPVDDIVELYLTCEPGIGYRGSYAQFRAFESAYLMNFTYGSEHPRECIDGHYYDRVIPNYFDPDDFTFNERKEDYFLYMGRLINRKGVFTAITATQAAGMNLVLAGQTDDEIDITKLPPHCKFVGYADAKTRNELMGKAKGVFVPTIYLEAFGGVAVEAMLCGTPIITTNFGVFPEYNVDGITGYRCNTLQDFVDACFKVHKLNPHVVRMHGERFLMDNVKHEFQRWFDDLYQVYLSTDGVTDGWNFLR